MPLEVIIEVWIRPEKSAQETLVSSIYIECDLIQSCQEYLRPSGNACFATSPDQNLVSHNTASVYNTLVSSKRK